MKKLLYLIPVLLLILVIFLFAKIENPETSQSPALTRTTPQPEVKPEKKVCQDPYSTPAQVANQKLCVEIANKPAEQTKGLGQRKSMAENEGMLFVFPNLSKYSFWMKDMDFDLDFIWIKNSSVIAITKNAKAPLTLNENKDENLLDYSPPSAIDKVLEVNAGWSDSHQIKVGDRLTY